MFAYCIIGIELVILYLVFWVVFIREPKPREIRAELWGRYQNSNERTTSTSRQSKLPEYLFLDHEELNPSLARSKKIIPERTTKMRRRHHRHAMHTHSAPCSCECHEQSAVTIANYRRGKSFQSRQQQINRNSAERFLLLLNRALNKLSVKIP